MQPLCEVVSLGIVKPVLVDASGTIDNVEWGDSGVLELA